MTYTIPLNRSGIPVLKVDLFEIDAVTLPFENDQAFIQALVKSGYLNHEMFQLKIAYQHNKENRFLDVLTNDAVLYKCSLECIRKKKRGETSHSIKLDTSSHHFKTIKNKFMTIANHSIGQKCIKEDIHLLPYGLGNEVSNYQRTREHLIRGASFEEEKDLRDIEKQITITFQKYKNIRGIRIWQKLYENGQLTSFYTSKEKKNNKPLFSTPPLVFIPKEEEQGTYIDTDVEYLTEDEKEMMAGDEGSTYRFRR